MGVPTTGSLANSPTTTPGPGVLPNGLYLAGDIRQSMDSDVSFYDTDNTRGYAGGEIPQQFTPETHLGKLAGYNNTPTERGKITFGVNKLKARPNQTQEVRMSDFANYTTTTFWSSSESGFDNFSNFKQIPSSSIFDFVAGESSFYVVGDGLNPGDPVNTVNYYNLAYINSNNKPELGVLTISQSRGGANGAIITQTGSNFSFENYCLTTSSLLTSSNATIICVDSGDNRNPGSSGTIKDNGYRTGCAYWQNGTSSPKMVIYSLSSSLAAPFPKIYVHSISETNPSTVYGAQIQKAITGNAYPYLLSGNNYAGSSLLIYNGFGDLRARRFTISGSMNDNSSTYRIFSGSEYTITTNVGGKIKDYVSVIGRADQTTLILYGENYNASLEGDNIVKMTAIEPSASNYGIDQTTFENNPELRLKSLEYMSPQQYWASSTEKYGSKFLLPLQGQEVTPNYGRERYLAVVAKSNGYIDVKLLTASSSNFFSMQPPLVTSEILNSIGYDGAFGGSVHHQLPVTAASLGVYTEYSSSLSLDPNAATGSKVEYVALSYTTDPAYLGSPLTPQTSIIKIYHSDGTMYHNTSGEKVVNNISGYHAYNDWTIPALPHRNVKQPFNSYYLPINYNNYPVVDATYTGRSTRFTQPMMFANNWAFPFRFTKTHISLY